MVAAGAHFYRGGPRGLVCNPDVGAAVWFAPDPGVTRFSEGVKRDVDVLVNLVAVWLAPHPGVTRQLEQ